MVIPGEASLSVLHDCDRVSVPRKGMHVPLLAEPFRARKNVFAAETSLLRRE